MADGRKRSTAKKARRDARRRKARKEPSVEEATLQEAAQDTPLLEEVREALDGAHPVDLLIMVSTLMLATSEGLRRLTFRVPAGTPDLADLVPAFIGVRVPETTALLAALGELLPEDDPVRPDCRAEVAARPDVPPGWLAGLGETAVHRAVRMRHVLGDADELVFGLRLADGQEMTAVAHVDHLAQSSVKDAFFVPESVDAVVSAARAANTDPDVDFIELELDDAGAELRYALDQPLTDIPYPPSDTWPGCYALVKWLARLFPVGGTRVVAAQRDWDSENEVVERFFGSLLGRAFDDGAHRSLLEDCADAGTGDPLRWSADRLRKLLTEEPVLDESGPSVGARLDVPTMLRAFVPFAHADSGIGQTLTDAAVAVIDDLADHYQALVMHAVANLEDVDDDS